MKLMSYRITTVLVIMALLALPGCGLFGSDGAEQETHSQQEEYASEMDGQLQAADILSQKDERTQQEAQSMQGESTPVQEMKPDQEQNLPEENTQTQKDDNVVTDSKTALDDAVTATPDRTADAASGSSEDEKANPSTGLLSSPSDINLTATDSQGKNYTFSYDGEEYKAIYTKDNWQIVDSYKIGNEDDMVIICQALIDEKPIHGKDMVSFRTAEDMAYEWDIHNFAYMILSEDDPIRKKAKDVDFDLEDQGRDFEEFYYSRTGKKFDLNSILGN